MTLQPLRRGDAAPLRTAHRQVWSFIAAGTFLLVAAVGSLPVHAAGQTRKPNFIVILIDDLGYRDVGVYGAKDIPTPHIDELARNGTRFVNSYSTCAVCSPARAALLTGRYQQRYGLEWVLSPHRTTGTCRWGLDEREKTLGDLLRQEGYVTAAVGKWHVGDREPFFPTNRGFDYFYGYLQAGHFYLNPNPDEREHPVHPWFRWALANGGIDGVRYFFDYYNAPVYRNHEVAGFQGYLVETLDREALQFIEKNKDRPFFLYLAHVGMHTPVQATEKYLSRFPSLSDEHMRRTYAAALSAVDDGIGEIAAKLRELDLDQNTVVFFSSDNGGPSFWKPRPEILDTVKAGTPLGAPKAGRKAGLRGRFPAVPVAHRRQRLGKPSPFVRQRRSLRRRDPRPVHRPVARRGCGRQSQRGRRLAPRHCAHLHRRCRRQAPHRSRVRRRGPAPLLRGQNR